MTRYSCAWLAAVAGITLGSVWSLAAQDSRPSTADAPAQGPSQGWTLTPALSYLASWDDNVLLKGVGDGVQGDFINVMNPRGDVEFNGGRSQFNAGYDGAFLIYRDLNSLNSYDQRAAASFKRLLTKHFTVVANNSFTAVPTTELALLVGTPYLRVGSQINDFRGGIEAALTKRSSITASYRLERVRFNGLPEFPLLRGGHSHGASFGLRHRLTANTAITADSEFDHAIVGFGGEAFDILNAGAGVERTVSDELRVSAEFGVSRLRPSPLNPARIGPMVRARLTWQFLMGSLDVGYSRSFVPAFGFGGTTDNNELGARLRVPLGRRVYAQSSLWWRSNDSLISEDPSIRSWSADASVGYVVQPRVWLEGFYGGMRQRVDRPGGQLDRTRFGVRIATGTPTRIR